MNMDKSRRLMAAKKMPPLKKREKDGKYIASEDQVKKWMAENQDLMNWLFDKVHDLGYVKYDPEGGDWVGVDYGE